MYPGQNWVRGHEPWECVYKQNSNLGLRVNGFHLFIAVIEGPDMVYRDFIDISVAVSTPKVCTGILVTKLWIKTDLSFFSGSGGSGYQKRRKNEFCWNWKNHSRFRRKSQFHVSDASWLNINSLSVPEVHNRVVWLLQARIGSLTIEDTDGGTFTISNGGVFGSLFGTPIINPPQSAILGMHGIFNRPVAVKGKVCSASFDSKSHMF